MEESLHGHQRRASSAFRRRFERCRQPNLGSAERCRRYLFAHAHADRRWPPWTCVRRAQVRARAEPQPQQPQQPQHSGAPIARHWVPCKVFLKIRRCTAPSAVQGGGLTRLPVPCKGQRAQTAVLVRFVAPLMSGGRVHKPRYLTLCRTRRCRAAEWEWQRAAVRATCSLHAVLLLSRLQPFTRHCGQQRVTSQGNVLTLHAGLPLPSDTRAHPPPADHGDAVALQGELKYGSPSYGGS